MGELTLHDCDHQRAKFITNHFHSLGLFDIHEEPYDEKKKGNQNISNKKYGRGPEKKLQNSELQQDQVLKEELIEKEKINQIDIKNQLKNQPISLLIKDETYPKIDNYKK